MPNAINVNVYLEFHTLPSHAWTITRPVGAADNVDFFNHFCGAMDWRKLGSKINPTINRLQISMTA